jgi:hypothetical protein
MTEEVTFAESLGIEAYTAEELDFKMEGVFDPVPEDKKAEYQAVEQNIKNAAASRIATAVQQAMSTSPDLQLGTVIGGYEYVDILCMSPRKLGVNPPWINLPHKIVAGNETIRHRALLLINPFPGPGGSPTGRHVLGSRPLRVTFNLLNVTTATALPPAFWLGTFPGLAPVLVTFTYDVTHPDPGPNPQIFELNVTFDCGHPEQPYAAFATQWWDIDRDPGWPWFLPGPTVPDVPPGRRVQIPLRYMVFTE